MAVCEYVCSLMSGHRHTGGLVGVDPIAGEETVLENSPECSRSMPLGYRGSSLPSK